MAFNDKSGGPWGSGSGPNNVDPVEITHGVEETIKIITLI
jgi:hypothetical protein